MVTTHNLGFPRIGAHRELKFALENDWRGLAPRAALLATGAQLRARHWARQHRLDLVPVGDFSYYDHMLDMSLTLGNLPARVRSLPGDALDTVFRVARGRTSGRTSDGTPAVASATAAANCAHGDACGAVAAADMTKWFDTNYHYIVPEFDADTTFRLDPTRLLAELAEARALGVRAKPVIVGPLTYLALGRAIDRSDRLALLPRLLPVYGELLDRLGAQGVEWVQIDEPLLATELDAEWQHAFQTAYHHLKACRVKLLVASYFGALAENQYLAANLPVAGLHIDAVRGRDDVLPLCNLMSPHKVLSLGVIDGRNIWKTDLNALLDWLEPLAERLGERLWIAPSCSLLHVPVDLDSEPEAAGADRAGLDAELRGWLAFACQKLDELELVATALRQGRAAVADALAANRAALDGRRGSPRVRNPGVQAAVAAIRPEDGRRTRPHAERAAIQAERLRLPAFPTTTIGSFPQTAEIRRARQAHRRGELDTAAYTLAMRAEIARSVREQETLGLDVLVHGEAERNDMVEYFGEQLRGYAFSEAGWVQSYGSRCVKPPILYGDVSRPAAMTVDWIAYAQSLTAKPVKGMLTGPVTMLNWSFVRDDQPRAQTCMQLALAIRAEVRDLERAGAAIIQIDEAALREGLPLRRAQWQAYLDWAVEAFRVAANGVRDDTQIHTHMCYSEFNDIIAAIAVMDADVITIETARSDMALLDAFERFAYPNAIGPGVFDIHSPNVPTEAQIVARLRLAAARIPADRLWVNPDCGLKTRQWSEVIPALRQMVAAARAMRGGHPLAAGAAGAARARRPGAAAAA